MWAPDQWKVNKGKIVAVHSPVLSPLVSEYKTVLDSVPHSMDSGFRVLDSSLSQWNLDSRFHSLVGYLSSILDSKALDSGFHRQNFPGFRILQAKIFQIPESGYQSNIF